MPAELRLRAVRVWAACAAAAVALVAPGVAHAEGGVGFRVDGTVGSTLEAGFVTVRATPGSSAKGHFEATNSGRQGVRLSVYSADGLTGDTTGIAYSAAGTTLHDAGTWMAPSTGGMLLPAAGSRRIDFSVRVPTGARAGDHVGGIVLEQRRSGGAISQIIRNVVPVLIEVSGPASSSMSLRSALVTDLPGTVLPAVTVKMINDGGRICRPTLTVSLDGPSENGTPVSRTLDAILPGDRVPFPLPWPRQLEKGTYEASVSLSNCGQTRTMRTDIRADATAETVTPTPAPNPSDPVVTAAAPGPANFVTPRSERAEDKGGANHSSDSGGASGPTSGGTGNPQGVSGGGSTSSAGGRKTGVVGTLAEIGGVAVKYLPPLLERLVAPLSLLGLMLLFLFAQETFDRKDPKLALAPIARDPDLEFLPLGTADGIASGQHAGELEVVRAPSSPQPLAP
jgi:uncharacterized membrane protein YgcG